MKNQPITAKIKRTTKGGITQPLLNMGAPVKMTAKAPSVAKDYNKGYPTPGSANKMMAPPPTPAKNKGLLKLGQKLLPAVRNQALATTKKAVQKSGPRTIEVIGKTLPKNNSGFMGTLKKIGALGVGGYLLNKLDNYTSANAASSAKDPVVTGTGQGGGKVGKKVGTVRKKKSKVSYDQAYEKRGKRYKNMDKASYIKEAKRQNAVYKKTGKWDVKDSYESKPKATVSELKTQPISQKKVEIKTKLDPQELKAKVPSGKKAPAAKPSKSQKIRAKGNAVLADKSLSTEDKQRKAQKLRKKYDKTVKKEVKRKARKERKVKYDEKTGTGGSIAGNLLRTVTGKRSRDRKKAQVRNARKATGSARQSSKAIDPTKGL